MPLIEALGGAVVRVKTLDGRELLVKAPEGRVLKPGETVVVHGEGMVKVFFFFFVNFSIFSFLSNQKNNLLINEKQSIINSI